LFGELTVVLERVVRQASARGHEAGARRGVELHTHQVQIRDVREARLERERAAHALERPTQFFEHVGARTAEAALH
jgi:hypothetical protein